ncbi:MAG: ribonuclease III [Saprospiraceae bacterium]
MTGFVPARISIFKLAFSHKSNQATKDYAQTNNERLEYLGDAVLGTIVAEYLFKKYPNGDEGFLTKMRSKIVKRKSLNDIGDKMGLDVLLTEYNRTRLSSSMLGNAVEALVGAVYLEKGYRGTKRFVIQRMLKLYVDMHELETVDDNYKSQLLEYCQKNGMQVNYKLLNKFKQDRRDRFKVAVMVNGEQISLADDFNKKSAEQLASLRALQKLGLVDKEAPIQTGRKSPTKGTPAVDRAPKRAKERKPKPPTKAPAKAPASKLREVSDEKMAVAAITKRQAEKPARIKVEKPAQPAKAKPAIAAKVKAPSKAKAPQQKSNAALPARKQRRNNSRLGRSIWNGVQTAGATIELADGFGFYDKPAEMQASRPAPKAKRASAKRVSKNQTIKETSNVQAETQKPTSPQGKRTTKPEPRQEEKVLSARKRRPIPLRLLTPIVKDASAVMAIDFDELFKVLGTTSKRNGQPAKNAPARKPRRKPAAKDTPKDTVEKSVDTSWEDTPLGLSTETAAAPKPKRSPRGKVVPIQSENVPTDELDTWEDTLLEINPEEGKLATELPEMYKKSTAKAPTNRRRPQRRSTNRKKKTEE